MNPNGRRWRDIRLTELSSLVAPRVSVFQGAERVPITDVLEIILDTSQQQVVLLTGVDCEYAQIYLRNFYRNDSRISVAEVAVWSDVDERCRVLICSESRTVLPPLEAVRIHGIRGVEPNQFASWG